MVNNKNYLMADEMFYLGEYQEVDVIYGIPYKESTERTRINLIRKGILDDKGNVNPVTVGYVELLKKYMKSSKYIHIHQYIYGIQEDGVCVVLKKAPVSMSEFGYELLLGDVVLLVQTALSHPIIQRSALKYYRESTYNIEVTPNNISEDGAILLIEHFDEKFEFVDELYIGMKDDRYYKVNEKLEFLEVIEEVDSVKWLIERVPQIKECLEKIIRSKGASENDKK